MAIVKTITSGSAVVHIDDSCCAGVSAEEMARRWAEVERVVWRIRENAARRAGEGEATAAAGESPSDPASWVTSPCRKRESRGGKGNDLFRLAFGEPPSPEGEG